MVRRGDPKPDGTWRESTIGDACSRWETLVLICHDCTPEGYKIYAEEFAAAHKLGASMTLWQIAQRLILRRVWIQEC